MNLLVGGGLGTIEISYSSSDGITYTRTDSGEEIIDFGYPIKWENSGDPWDDTLGEFMKTSSYYFGGLYKYQTTKDPTKANIYALYDNNHSIGSTVTGFITMEEIKKACDLVKADRPTLSSNSSFTVWKNENNTIELAFAITGSTSGFYQYKVLYEGTAYMGYSTGSGQNLIKYTFTDLDNGVFTSTTITEEQHTVTFNGRSSVIKIYRNTLENYVGFTNVSIDGTLYQRRRYQWIYC